MRYCIISMYVYVYADYVCHLCLQYRLRVAYALAADNSVLSVPHFLAQSIAISSIKLNAHQVPMITGE